MSNFDTNAMGRRPGVIKIIGIGQSMRGDDAAGLEAVRLWQATYQVAGSHPQVQVELAELPGLDLLNLLEGTQEAILVDATQSGAIPGSIRVLAENQLDAFSAGSESAHGWGVAETLSLGRQLMPSSMPSRLVLIGIEAAQLGLGDGLSQQVHSALPAVARLIHQYVIAESNTG